MNITEYTYNDVIDRIPRDKYYFTYHGNKCGDIISLKKITINNSVEYKKIIDENPHQGIEYLLNGNNIIAGRMDLSEPEAYENGPIILCLNVSENNPEGDTIKCMLMDPYNPHIIVLLDTIKDRLKVVLV